MLELSPPSRGIVNSELLNQHLLSQLKGRPTMSEKMHESVSPLQRDATDLPVKRASSEHRSNVRNSSEDPSISSTHTARHVSSNSRVHPRASNHIHSSSHHSKSWAYDKQCRVHDSKSRSHDYHKTPKRKRSVDGEEESAVWTEHISSSGRVYYYNKKEDKSQWEKPKGLVKRPKEDLASPGSKSSSRPSTNTPSVKPSHTSNSNTHLRSHKELVNHKDLRRKSHHEHHNMHKGEGRGKEHTSYSHSRHGRDSRSGSHSTSPASTKHRSDKTPSRHRYSGRTVTTSPITPKSKPVMVSPTTPSSHSQLTPGDLSSVNRNGDPAQTVDSGEQQTPTHLTVRQQLDFTPQVVLNGPTTPDVGNLLCSPQPGLMEASGLHPLQKALLLQNQFSQQQQPFDPSLCMTPPSALPAHLSHQGSRPSSPLVQSPLSRTPPVITPPAMQSMTPVQGCVFVMPTSVHGTFGPGITGQAMVPSVQATSVQNVVSRLGYGSVEGYNFPDVSLLKISSPSFIVDGELMDKSLAESWTKHNDQLQSQVDNCVHDMLQVSLTDPVLVSGRQVVSRLRLEAMQVTTNTTDVRLSALAALMDEINNR